jgi:hypothetical protein
MARGHITRYGYYNKAEASDFYLSLGISQGVIDGWYSVAASEGPQKHPSHKNQGGGELYLSGAELIRLAMKALGQSWVIGL